MVEIGYAYREQVQDLLVSTSTARMDVRIDQARLAASRDIEGLLHRIFYPWTGTRQLDQPAGTTLWLYENELAEVPTGIVSGATTLTTDDYIMQPLSGPPYRWIDINYGGSNSWSSDDTPQRAVAITGTFGYPAVITERTEIAGAINAAATALVLAETVHLGTGSLILVDDERMLITQLQSAATGATLDGNVAANKGATGITVSDGSLITAGERILIGSESMNVLDVAGDTLIVERAARGTVLAAHATGATVYAPRAATVQRGLLGTTAAAHDDASTVYSITAPSLVVEAVLALTANNLQQGLSGYSRPVGGGDNKREATGRGVQDVLEDCYTRYGRKTRSRAV